MQTTQLKTEPEFPAPPDAGQVREELASILDSSVFRTSKRCHDFLVYVVTRALQGDLQHLRERSIAVEVFGRKTDAALGDDSIVRVGAREVRKRLAQYYMTEGVQSALRIELPPGSYVPVFHPQFTHSLDHPEPGPAVLPLIPAPEPQLAAVPKVVAEPTTWLTRKATFVVAAVLALLLAALLARRFTRPAVPEEFEAFWRPAFSQTGPVFLGLAHPLVYHPSNRLIKLDEQAYGATLLQRQIHVRADAKAGDYVPVFDQYVGFGDAMAAARLSILFSQHNRTLKSRLASQLSFADLRDSSTVLIGAFTNRWALEMVQPLRFRFGMSLGVPWILDSRTSKKWTLSGKTEDGLANEDYILICRLTHAQTGGFVIVGAGLTHYGTEEAGRILSDPSALAPLLRKVSPDWRNKNLQLVLHSRVLGETSTAPDLIASHVW